MKRILICAVLGLQSMLSSSFLAAQERGLVPVPLIFDTDIGNDCDDVLAMGVIHALQTRGECELLAVTITKDHPLAAAFSDAVNTFYGRGEIPIGVCRSGVTSHAGKFNLLAGVKDGDQDRYPHDLRSGESAMDAVPLLRQTLATQDDGGVVIVQVGFSTNMANLLQSKPDEISPLSGLDLVRRKVRLLSVMAGAFAKIKNENGQAVEHREYNVIKDIPSAQVLVKDWPTPIVWSGFEIGKDLPYPHQSILTDFRYAANHPLPQAYTLYQPPPHNRPTWDLTSVLVAVRPGHDYFDVSQPGTVGVDDDGLTTYKPSADGRDRYLIVRDSQKARVTEALVQLASQPPAAFAADRQAGATDRQAGAAE